MVSHQYWNKRLHRPALVGAGAEVLGLTFEVREIENLKGRDEIDLEYVLHGLLSHGGLHHEDNA